MSASTQQTTQTAAASSCARTTAPSELDEVMELRKQAAAISQRIERLMVALLGDPRERQADA